MTRHFLVLFLTLFQDNYVRVGTLLGALAGLWSPEILNGEPVINTFVFGFIGWGVGAYLAHYRSANSQYSKKKKFRVFQGGQ